MIIRKAAIVATALATVGIGTVAGIAVGDGDPTAAVPTRQLPREAPRTQTIDERLTAAFAVFRQPASGDDAPAPLAKGALGNTAGANAGLSRTVGARSRFTSGITPAAGALCQTLSSNGAGGGASCLPVENVTESGMTMTVGAPGSAGPGFLEIYGVAPDWVTQVEFADPSSDETVTSHVTKNGYSAIIPDSLRHATLVGSGRRLRIAI